MKVRVGTDLVDIGRFRRKIQSSPAILAKIFSQKELNSSDPAHLAGIFATKEATIKALDLPVDSWRKFSVTYRKTGKPSLQLPPSLKKRIKSCDLSISHQGNYAWATFVAVLND